MHPPEFSEPALCSSHDVSQSGRLSASSWPCALTVTWVRLADRVVRIWCSVALFRRAFRRILLSPHISLSSMHQVLNFVELTERQRWPLPVDTQLLAAVAEKCQAYAKAVRYREELWPADPGNSGSSCHSRRARVFKACSVFRLSASPEAPSGSLWFPVSCHSCPVTTGYSRA